jgi:hypothetical protein
MSLHLFVSPAAKINRNNQIVARAGAGEAPAALAREYGLSRIRIRQILADHPKTMLAINASRGAPGRLDPMTEMRGLTVSARLREACGTLGAKTVADLANSLAEFRRLPNTGRRTTLEALEIVRKAGIDLPVPIERRRAEAGPPHGKRSILRNRGYTVV